MEEGPRELKPPVTNANRKEIIKTIPTIYEHQLVPSIHGNGKSMRGISIYDSYIIALTGPRGGIKSGSLAYCCMKFMAAGLPVFTNQPVKFNIIRRNGDVETLESQTLDFEQLFTHREIRGGLVAIDEYQQWDRSSRAMTSQHVVLMGMWEQIRKIDLSFYYVAKRMELVPGDIAWETDIEINCSDITPYPNSGVACLWQVKDLSGLWTRKMFDPRNPIFYKQRFYHRAIWGAYDTRQNFDFYDAMRGVKMDLTKRVLTDGNGKSDLDLDLIKRKSIDMLTNEELSPIDYWRALGVLNTNLQKEVKDLVWPEVGIRYKGTSSNRRVVLDEGMLVT